MTSNYFSSSFRKNILKFRNFPLLIFLDLQTQYFRYVCYCFCFLKFQQYFLVNIPVHIVSCMYVYMYVFIYICACMYVYKHLYVYHRIHVRVYVYKHVCMYINGIVIFRLFLVLKLINHVRSFQGWLQTKIYFW